MRIPISQLFYSASVRLVRDSCMSVCLEYHSSAVPHGIRIVPHLEMHLQSSKIKTTHARPDALCKHTFCKLQSIHTSLQISLDHYTFPITVLHPYANA
jgi:hypothetical protein